MDYQCHSPKERGAALIMTAGFMLLAVLSLALVVDTGRLYAEKRNLQRIADITALEVASRFGCGNSRAQAIAQEAATRNKFTPSSSQSITARCGFISIDNNARRFTASASSMDAVEIEVSREVVASMIAGGVLANKIRLSVRATAQRSSPTTVFRIGSKLLNTNQSAPLMSLLSLVGVNLSGTTIASYNSLAGIKVTPSGLLKALGIPVAADITAGGLNELLAVSKLSVGDVLDAVVTVAGQDGLLGANIELVNALQAQLGINDLAVQLGTDPSINNTTGLFALIETAGVSGKSALDVGVDALSIVNASLGIATKQQGVNLNLGGNNLLTGLKAGVRIVEPQSIGIGGVGATANNAQLRINVDLNTTQGLTGILALLGTSIKLPLTIDTVQAVATVTSIDCNATPQTASIRVDTAVANACLGRVSPSALWSTKEVCASSLQNETFVRLLGINILQGQVKLPILASTPQTLTLKVGETKTTNINNLAIGTLLKNLLDELLDLLGNSSFATSPLSVVDATSVADSYLGLPALAPTGGGGNYDSGDLTKIQNRLDSDGVNWDRPAFLFTGNMLSQWRSSVTSNCSAGLFRYNPACARTRLISALQTEAAPGFLGFLLDGLLGDLVKPLLASILGPVVSLLSGLLDGIGSLLANLLSNTIGLDLTRSDITLDELSCGSPALVI